MSLSNNSSLSSSLEVDSDDRGLEAAVVSKRNYGKSETVSRYSYIESRRRGSNSDGIDSP